MYPVDCSIPNCCACCQWADNSLLNENKNENIWCTMSRTFLHTFIYNLKHNVIQEWKNIQAGTTSILISYGDLNASSNFALVVILNGKKNSYKISIVHELWKMNVVWILRMYFDLQKWPLIPAMMIYLQDTVISNVLRHKICSVFTRR